MPDHVFDVFKAANAVTDDEVVQLATAMSAALMSGRPITVRVHFAADGSTRSFIVTALEVPQAGRPSSGVKGVGLV